MMRRGNRDDVVVAAARERMLPMALRIVEQRLRQWASEYRDHPTRAWTILGKLIEHKGFVPDVRGHVPIPTDTPADEIESIVQGMMKIGLNRCAMVLRCEYFDQHSPDIARLEHLRALGHPMIRSDYYEALYAAKLHVAVELRVKERMQEVARALR